MRGEGTPFPWGSLRSFQCNLPSQAGSRGSHNQALPLQGMGDGRTDGPGLGAESFASSAMNGDDCTHGSAASLWEAGTPPPPPPRSLEALFQVLGGGGGVETTPEWSVAGAGGTLPPTAGKVTQGSSK